MSFNSIKKKRITGNISTYQQDKKERNYYHQLPVLNFDAVKALYCLKVWFVQSWKDLEF